MSQAWRAFVAQFEGWCPRCHKNIEPGQHCVYDDDEKPVHLTCAEEEE